jgi:REP element-mobilizing transposase RayT
MSVFKTQVQLNLKHPPRCVFGEVQDDSVVMNQLGMLVEEEWLRTAVVRPGVELDAYVIMPNHLHGILGLPYDCSVGATRPPQRAAGKPGRPYEGS